MSSALNLISVLSQAKTSHRQLLVHAVLSAIVNQDLCDMVAHSSILCKKCFKLIDDIDSLEGQLMNLKQASETLLIDQSMYLLWYLLPM